MKFTKKRVALLVFLGFSFLLTLVLRLTFDNMVDAIIDYELKQKLPLKKGNLAYHFWIKPPVPVAFRIFVFDIVNPEEILAGTSVPIVVEKGPYVYRMHLKKTNITFHDNNTVEYRQPEKFIYDREASAGPENDTFTTVNIPFITVASILQYEPAVMQEVTDAFFRSQGESPFMTKTVKDIWWGYKDPVLEDAAAILHSFNYTSALINGKFGFFMDRNNTDDGLYNVNSGRNRDFSDYVMIDHWNGLKKQSAWNSDYANRIKGSGDGSMQPPGVTKDDKLSIFDSNLRRTLNLEFNQTTTVQGVDALRFLIPYSEFANAKDNPDNAGYCTPSTDHCPPSGVFNMSVVSHYAPVCASLPHFVGGDPYYQRQVKGLRPSQEKHQPYYDYHSITGVALSASRRYQLVLKTKAFKNFEAFRNFPDAYIPILWIDGLANMDHATISLFKNQIQDTLEAMVYVKAFLIVATCISFVVVIAVVIYWRRKDSKEDLKALDNSERSPLLKNGHVQQGDSNGTSGRYERI